MDFHGVLKAQEKSQQLCEGSPIDGSSSISRFAKNELEGNPKCTIERRKAEPLTTRKIQGNIEFGRLSLDAI
jgi:hypothetical protein